MSEKALSPYRVLDLTDEKGFLCGKILADLGADVIKVEPPGGDNGRMIGPFYKDIPHPERSLFWFAYNTGKRGITLDIESGDGHELFKRLVATADLLIESFPPGYMDGLGLGYSQLEKVNPGLIMVSITPFGQTGPYSRWRAPDIVPWAMGGYMWMTGEPERAPLRISHPPQSYLHASAMAAAGSLMALRHRALTGQGQHVDLSAQQCPSWMLTHTYAYWDMMKVNLKRAGVRRQFGLIQLKTVWPCRDGHVSFMFAGGLIGAKGQRRVVELMEQEGMAEDWLKELRWEEFDAFTALQEDVDRITDAFGRYFLTQTKVRLLDEAVEGGIMLAPVNTVKDVLEDVHLEARGFWEEVEHPELGTTIAYPGAPCKMTETPWQVKGRAPLIGEHNDEVYNELPLAGDRHVVPKQAGAIPAADERRPLDGVRVLDFSATVLGPTVTRYLADHGATVVRVESITHPDTSRIATPYAGGEFGLNRSGYFATHNAGKLSITLNMRKPKAIEVAKRLIKWADVVIESFVPGVMKRWGLNYDQVSKIKPDIIMASTCLQGQSGPRSPHRGYGQMVSAMAGWFELTGWPDGDPLGPYSAYSDFIDWNYMLLSILAALEYRERTGKGQYIDQSQFESALHFLAPALLDYAVNGRIATRIGNRDPHFAPHGAYRCRGDDRWCVIAITSDEEWQAFARVIGEVWAKDTRFRTVLGRKQNEDELDRLVEVWTQNRSAEEVMTLLQGAGVPAAVVQNSEDLFNDPQLEHRGHFAVLDHPEIGPYRITSAAFRLSKCPNNPRSPAPLFGEHNEYVLREFLGMSADEIADLVAEGVLE